MKALAHRVSEGAKEIDGLVSAVQQESANAVRSIERGAASVHEVVGLARKAERSLDQIAVAARESGDRMGESARAASAQKAVASEVARQMERVRESAEVLRALGGEVTMRLYPGMGHLVNEDEIEHVRAMLAAALA